MRPNDVFSLMLGLNRCVHMLLGNFDIEDYKASNTMAFTNSDAIIRILLLK